MPKTDHSADIQRLRELAKVDTFTSTEILETSADLLELHDRQSLSLDKWPAARKMVEEFIGHDIEENGV